MSVNDSDILKALIFFSRAFPKPHDKNFHTQLGVHFEEIAEMLETLRGSNRLTQSLLTAALVTTSSLALHLKSSEGVLQVDDRQGFLDGLCDQLVTASGVGYMAKMDIAGGFAEVNRSNLSKFDDNGEPILDSNLKLVKGPNYFKPDLKRFADGPLPLDTA